MRLARMLASLPLTLVWASAVAAGMLAVRKIAPERLADRTTALGLGGVVLTSVIYLLAAALRRLPPSAGALALDRHHGGAGRLPNALEFADVPEPARTPMMRAAIEDARDAFAAGLSPREAVPVPVPAELGLGLVALVGLALVALAEVPRWVAVPALVQPPSVDALELSEDDLALFRDALRDVVRDDDNPELREAVGEFNRLIEDLAERRLSRDEAFRRLRELDERMSREAAEERDAMKQALADLSNELSQSELSRPTSDALRKQEFGRARDELKKLTERLAGKKKPSKAELERLKKALDRASSSNKQALERLEEKRAELRSSLLKAKEASEKEPNDERKRSLLRKKERELSRLDRDVKRREAAARKLNRLERQLGKAAADLLRDLGVSAEELEQLTEDLNRMEEEQLTDKEKEELRQRIEELRELIRQEGQGGERLKQRMQRFTRRARGSESGSGKGERGPRGKRRPGGQGAEQGDDGELRPGGGGGSEEGDGEGMGKGLRLGKGGRSIPIEVGGGKSGGAGADGDGASGSDAGRGSAEKLGKASDIEGRTRDVEAEGLDSGRGASNAEVILGAAERGFTGKGYRKVFKQYETVAEDQVAKETIPDGMRFYVRRYFQLIRPRE